MEFTEGDGSRRLCRNERKYLYFLFICIFHILCNLKNLVHKNSVQISWPFAHVFTYLGFFLLHFRPYTLYRTLIFTYHLWMDDEKG